MCCGTEMSAILREHAGNLKGVFLCHLKLRKEDPGLGFSTQVHLPPPPKFTKIKLGKWFSGRLQIQEH